MPRRKKQSSEAAVREIRRKTRRRFSAEEKIRIVLDGLRGEVSVAELCRREGIAANLLSLLKTWWSAQSLTFPSSGSGSPP
jgi:transposase-like protein